MATVTGDSDSNTVFCTQCGTEIPESASKCQGCGAAQNPSSLWARIVILLCGVTVVFMILQPDPSTGSIVDTTVGFATLFAWIGLPIATYKDMKHVRETGDWEPSSGLWMVGLLCPILNIGPAIYYLKEKYANVGTL